MRSKAVSPARAVLRSLAIIDVGTGTEILRKVGIALEGGVLVASVWTPDGERKLGAFDLDADPMQTAQDIYARAIVSLQPRVVPVDDRVEVKIPATSGAVEIIKMRLRTPPALESREEERQRGEEFMARQEVVTVVVSEDTPVSYNGFRVLLKANTPTSVPKPIADLLHYSEDETRRMRRGVMMCLTCGVPAPCRCFAMPGVTPSRPRLERESVING